MDFGIKFHTEKLTGYALRVIRVKEASDAVAMALVEYRDGKSRYPTALQMVSCYLTGFVRNGQIGRNNTDYYS